MSDLIQEAITLLNENEHSEALKNFRQFHDIRNGFKCFCGRISSKMSNTEQCPDCARYNPEDTIIYQGEGSQFEKAQARIDKLSLTIKRLYMCDILYKDKRIKELEGALHLVWSYLDLDLHTVAWEKIDEVLNKGAGE